MTQRHNAIITGASRGFGRALAAGLAAEGWNLIVVARTEEALHEAASSLARRVEVVPVVGDIREPGARARIADAASRFGQIDLLVNNAGGLGPAPLPALTDYDLDAMSDLFELNVVAQLGVLQSVAAHLADDATVVMLSSDASVNAYPGWGGYGATKAALDHLARVLAVENRGWRLLSVDPGDMRTAMHQRAFPGEDISDRPEPEASVTGLLELIDGGYASGRYQARSVEGGRR